VGPLGQPVQPSAPHALVLRPGLRPGIGPRDFDGCERRATGGTLRSNQPRPGAIRVGKKGKLMKIVVIGGTGLIGSKLVQKLRAGGHDPLAASPATGVDIITGKGLAEALAGAQVVVDVSNAPPGVMQR
jgi:hypothetical protein